MKVGAPRETFEAEARVAMTPDSALQLQKIGHTCFIESGAGLAAGFTDAAYEAAGVTKVDTAVELFEEVDVVVKVRPPSTTEAGQLRMPRR
jgi:H+-translocating NAD(P) transhydrogenase subunit alpha